MPVYVYKNLTTGETFEVTQRITEDALTSDPRTGDPVKRVVQPVGIAFKGSGFYVTDNRGSSKNGAASSKTSDAASAAKPETKSETKSSSASTSTSTGAAAD